MATRVGSPPETYEPTSRQSAFDRRLEEIGWGVFLLMTGLLWLFSEQVPSGTWLIATGVLLLGLNVVRYVKRVPIGAFSTTLGVLALVGGLSELGGVEAPLLATALIVVGGIVLLRPRRKARS
ncbi:MAG TPA: hypothetical protein VFZ11_05530 [Gemmatimonadaceae bacterium]